MQSEMRMIHAFSNFSISDMWLRVSVCVEDITPLSPFIARRCCELRTVGGPLKVGACCLTYKEN